MLSASPLGRRRYASAGNVAAAVSNESLHNGLVWGVSLDKLVSRNKSKQRVPFIVEKIVEHVEKHGVYVVMLMLCSDTVDRIVSGRIV